MDEPRVKYIPVDVIKEYFNRYSYIIPGFDDLVEKFGIDVIRYKSSVTVSDEYASMLKGYTNFTAEEHAKRRASEMFLENYINEHIKLVDKERVTKGIKYRYDIMIGEIPKCQQKEETE